MDVAFVVDFPLASQNGKAAPMSDVAKMALNLLPVFPSPTIKAIQLLSVKLRVQVTGVNAVLIDRAVTVATHAKMVSVSLHQRVVVTGRPVHPLLAVVIRPTHVKVVRANQHQLVEKIGNHAQQTLVAATAIMFVKMEHASLIVRMTGILVAVTKAAAHRLTAARMDNVSQQLLHALETGKLVRLLQVAAIAENLPARMVSANHPVPLNGTHAVAACPVVIQSRIHAPGDSANPSKAALYLLSIEFHNNTCNKRFIIDYFLVLYRL